MSFGGGGAEHREEIRQILLGNDPPVENLIFAIFETYGPRLQTSYSKALAYVLIGYFERGLVYRYALLIIGGLIFSANRPDNNLVQISLQDLGVLTDLIEELFNYAKIRIEERNRVEEEGFEYMKAKISKNLPKENLEEVLVRFEVEVEMSFIMIREAIANGVHPKIPWHKN
jgi:hypothetical protein